MTGKRRKPATSEQRRRFVLALNRMDGAWMTFLKDQDFLDINYSDLLTGLWLSGKPVRKQQAVKYMRHLSPQTAKKYLDHAIDKGYLVESADPQDGRARLIGLSASLKRGLESFFDYAIDEFRQAVK